MDIQKLISEMTLEEKASLLSGSDFWHTKAVERLGIPAVMVSDGPHGLRKQDMTKQSENDSIKAVCFPTGCATAASFDREVLRREAVAIGQSAQHEQLAAVLGPAICIKRSPLCGRNFEYVSEDPYVAGELAATYVAGVQSQGVGTSLKHFACNDQEYRRLTSSSNVDERTLREIYLSAFEKTVKRSQPWTVMCSYNKINGVQVAENAMLLTDILRDEWGYEGLVVSDWGAVADRPAGVSAGMDLEMPGSKGENDKRIVKAVREGRLDEKEVDLCVARVLHFVDRAVSASKPETPWDMDAQHELARELAAECMVLLKNDGDLLPLKKDAKIAVLGAFAKTPRFQGGGSSHINTFKSTSAMDALAGYPNVAYADGYKGVDPDEVLLSEAEQVAKAADVVVIFAGLPDVYESEGYDRKHLRMPESHNQLIERAAAVNPNVVVVLHNGSPVVMPWLDRVKAVLEVYLGGQAVGGATVDVLFGDKCPSGRLPETFPLSVEDTPCYPWFGGEKDVTEYREGVFVGYRWYDKKKMPVLFPFGYGLSYTAFDFANLRVSADSVTDNDTITVQVDVTNTGKRADAEVVQLYVAPPADGIVIRPVRELKGFEKVALDAGETKTVAFTLDKRSFAYWNTTVHDWVVESGVYTIQIGKSSRELVLGAPVTVASTAKLPRHFTLSSIVGDVLECPKACEILAPMLKILVHNEQVSEEAREAITAEASIEMAKQAPLRSMLSFSPGQMTYDEMQSLVDKLNAALDAE